MQWILEDAVWDYNGVWTNDGTWNYYTEGAVNLRSSTGSRTAVTINGLTQNPKASFKQSLGSRVSLTLAPQRFKNNYDHIIYKTAEIPAYNYTVYLERLSRGRR